MRTDNARIGLSILIHDPDYKGIQVPHEWQANILITEWINR